MMRKFLFLHSILLLFLASANAQENSDRLQKLLTRFDATLKNRDAIHAAREWKIEEIKQIFNNPQIPIDQRLDVGNRLFWEYIEYQVDSAFHYAGMHRELALKVGDNEMVVWAELNFAEALSIAGLNSDLADALDSISTMDMTLDQYKRYLFLRVLLYENLNSLNSQTNYPELRSRYHQPLYDACTSLLEMQTPESDGFLYYVLKVRLLNLDGKQKEIRQLLENNVNPSGMVCRDEATYYYYLGRACEKGAGTTDDTKYYYILAAIADLKCGDREHFAPYKVAEIFYNEGDIDRAYRYMKVAIEDINFSNSYKRLHRQSQMLELIDSAYQEERTKQQHILHVLLAVSIMLIILLACTVIYIAKLYRNYRLASVRLSVMYKELKELTDNLHDSDTIKQAYIVRYMDLYMDSINQMNTRLKRIGKLMKADNEAELNKMLDTSLVEQENLEIFYKNFDTTFLNLFPDFVTEYNKLLNPESKVIPKKRDRLNTELRIYALIRLGVADSVKISEFFHYSLSTVYNNRTAARNKSIVDRNRFEEYVMQIGKIKKDR